MRKILLLLVFLLLINGVFAVQYDGIESNPNKPQCSDGIDNDGDGLIDLNDVGCGDDMDMDETDPVIVCGTGDGKNVYLTVDFLKIFNNGTGNLNKKVYADNGMEIFDDGQQIPLVIDGVPVKDNKITNDVNGIAIQRGSGWVYFVLQGKHLPRGSGLESMVTKLSFTKKIMDFLDHSLEKQGDGIFEWKNAGQDEVFPNTGGKIAKWVSSVDVASDGFYLWYELDNVVFNESCKECNDGIDNDGDGNIDYPADGGCKSSLDDREKTSCQDGKDNDGDGLIDMADPGCDSINDGSEKNKDIECDDGKDNDGDGLIDMADPGCSDSLDDDETDDIYECNDGLDNDGDTYVDYPNDPGCSSKMDDSELNPAIQCDDGVDNDGDGLIDYPDDLGCLSPLDNSEFGMVINGSKFRPLLWLDPDTRKVFKSAMDGGGLSDRGHNYAFEGEQIKWEVLVMDKNGIEKIKDVFVSMGKMQGPGNDIEVNCKLDQVLPKNYNITRFNARIGQEKLIKTTADNTFAIYDCLFTVETQSSMHGEFWVTVEAEDLDGLIGSLDENEFWFFNPFVSVGIIGELNFGELMPGHTLYSDTILLRNDAEDESGVELNMYISGTDFYDPSHSGAKCPLTNKLDLGNFGYYAVNGAFTSAINPGADVEGYDGIVYGDMISNSETIIGGVPFKAPVADGNVLNEGNEMSITFRLNVPEPCNGEFSDGDIFFWFDVV